MNPRPLRFNMVKAYKKPLLKWLFEFRYLMPCKSWSSEEDKYVWRRLRQIPRRYELDMGKMLSHGDAGYDEATYEIGFIEKDFCLKTKHDAD